MDEQLQKQLAGYLDSIATAAKTGSQFVIEQTPLVVQEKVTYGRAIETFTLAALLLAIVFCVWVVRVGLRSRDEYGVTEGGVAAVIAGVIVGGIACVSAVVQADAVLMVWVAPRLYILEWAMSLLKK
jgi:hypothetical protein